LTSNAPQQGLVLSGLSIALDGEPLFNPLTLRIEPGAIHSLMGASGAGKSTLLAAIAGTLDPVFGLSGEILLDGESLRGTPAHRRGVGLLFQEDLLFPHMTVAENLTFALPRGLTREEKNRRVGQALEQMEMRHLGERKPYAISGGQRLRAALMRTFLSEPRALLLDEPFSKLDAGLRRRIRNWVYAHIRKRGVPALMVSHDLEDAQAADGNRICYLQDD